MSEITNPHDRFFKELLSQRTNARDFLRYYLPPKIVAELDLRKIELVGDEFVDEDLNSHLADLLYRVKLKQGDEAFIFVLFEHKSTPEKFVAFQILRYIVRLWDKSSQQGVRRFPVVYPIVLYHGRRAWNVPRNLRAIVDIDTHSPFLNFVPDFEYFLIDLAELKEEYLQGTPYLRAGLLVLKYIFDRELEKHLPDIFRALKGEPEKSLIGHLKTVVTYLSKVKNQLPQDTVASTLIKTLHEIKGDIMLGFVDEWIQKGRTETAQSIAMRLLNRQLGIVSPRTEIRIKKLSAKELEELTEATLDFKSYSDLDSWLQKRRHA